MHCMDLNALTFTDDNGDDHNALDYLMKDGNLGVPGGHYGSDTSDCAPIALMLYAVLLEANGSDAAIVECLDGCMSSVVNSSDEVCWSILDNGHVFMDRTCSQWALVYRGSPCSPYDFFDNETIVYARELYSEAYCGEAPTF